MQLMECLSSRDHCRKSQLNSCFHVDLLLLLLCCAVLCVCVSVFSVFILIFYWGGESISCLLNQIRTNERWIINSSNFWKNCTEIVKKNCKKKNDVAVSVWSKRSNTKENKPCLTKEHQIDSCCDSLWFCRRGFNKAMCKSQILVTPAAIYCINYTFRRSVKKIKTKKHLFICILQNSDEPLRLAHITKRAW